jgi:hypothetical protein
VKRDVKDLGVNSERMLERLLTAMPEHPARFRDLCGAVEDWDLLLTRALHHNVESLLHHYLQQIGFTLPSAIEERVQRWKTIKDLWQTHVQCALDETLATLEAASIPVIALKGPILGERVYPDPRMRLSADLDLLVASNDLHRAITALKTIGYGPARESEARFLRKYHYHINLSRSCPPLIELHFRLSDGFGVEIPGEEFLSRARAYRRAAGAVAYILSPEDETLYLCIHATVHRFLRLSWLCDIKLLLLRHPDLDWAALMHRAQELRLVAPLRFACATLQARLGVSTPFDGVTPHRIRTRIANFLLAATARQPDPSRRFLLGKLGFMTALCDRPGTAWAFLHRQLLLIARRRAHRHFPSLTPEEWSY